MAVKMEDLPPAQAQAQRKMAEQSRKKEPAPPAWAESKEKYHNVRTDRTSEAGGRVNFDSKKEARRYDELMAMLRAGKIRDLKLQPQFTIQEAYTTPGGAARPSRSGTRRTSPTSGRRSRTAPGRSTGCGWWRTSKAEPQKPVCMRSKRN